MPYRCVQDGSSQLQGPRSGLRPRAARLAHAVRRGLERLRAPAAAATAGPGESPVAVAAGGKAFENRYLNEEEMRRDAAAGRHRESIGGHWETLGKLQFDLLVSQGLRPEHRLLDIGCGCLRAGVHLVRYLQPGRYYGIDASQALLEAGRTELAALRLERRVPPKNLICTADFDVSGFDVRFEFALAHSVFTHLSLNHLRLCLNHLSPQMETGGRFYVSFFEVSACRPVPDAFCHGEITTFAARDPFHYPFRDFEHMALGTGWRAHYVGEWEHPRGARMMYYERMPGTASEPRAA